MGVQKKGLICEAYAQDWEKETHFLHDGGRDRGRLYDIVGIPQVPGGLCALVP